MLHFPLLFSFFFFLITVVTLSHRWLISFCFKVCGVFTKDGLSLQVYVNAIVIHVLCVSVAPHRNFLYSCKAIVCSSIVYSEVNITITTFSTYCRTVFLNFFFLSLSLSGVTSSYFNLFVGFSASPTADMYPRSSWSSYMSLLFTALSCIELHHFTWCSTSGLTCTPVG